MSGNEGGGPSYDDLVSSGRVGHNSMTHAQAMPGHSGAGGMLPIEGTSLENVIFSEGISGPISGNGQDSIFDFINKGGGALGGTLNKLGEQALDYLGTPHAKGDSLDLSQVTATEIRQANIGNLSSEARLKEVGMIGGGEQSH
jgi:hypothetical protein